MHDENRFASKGIHLNKKCANELGQPLINFMVCFIERGECPLDS
jgi:hypothetical protein